MKTVLKLVARPVYRRYRDLLLRVSELEIAVDSLVRSPKWTASEDMGFNGQAKRKELFLDLLSALHFEAIVETGTFLGNTTGYLATASNLPVYSCELRRRFHDVARMRLEGFQNVSLKLQDSKSFLLEAVSTGLAGKATFFYLDAHWYDELPLTEEVGIIAEHWSDFAIMIDDFEVPSDPGYSYDVYGRTRLSLDHFGEYFSRLGLSCFFPSAPSATETGGRAGCVILVRRGSPTETLKGLRSLTVAAL